MDIVEGLVLLLASGNLCADNMHCCWRTKGVSVDGCFLL